MDAETAQADNDNTKETQVCSTSGLICPQMSSFFLSVQAQDRTATPFEYGHGHLTVFGH